MDFKFFPSGGDLITRQTLIVDRRLRGVPVEVGFSFPGLVPAFAGEIWLVGTLSVPVKRVRSHESTWTILNDVLIEVFDTNRDEVEIRRLMLAVNRSEAKLSRFTMSPFSLRGGTELFLSGHRLTTQQVTSLHNRLRGIEESNQSSESAWTMWLSKISEMDLEGSLVGKVKLDKDLLRVPPIARDGAAKIIAAPTPRIEDLQPGIASGEGLIVAILGRAQISQLMEGQNSKSEIVALYPYGAERAILAVQSIGGRGFARDQKQPNIREQGIERLVPKKSTVAGNRMMVSRIESVKRDSKIEMPFEFAN